MKKASLFAAATLAAMMPMAALAVPYASNIKVGSTSVVQGAGTAITYVLNHAADSVTIDILDGSDAVLATFAGTATAGTNSVSWDGTVDNAGGADVAAGAGYRVRVTAAGPIAAGWTRYKAQGSPTSNPVLGDSDVVSDWFPKGLVVNTDPDSDHFGSAVAGFGYVGATGIACNAAATIEFTADLEVKAGDNGYGSRALKHPNDDLALPHPRSYTIWGMSWDNEDPNRIWYLGQATSGGVADANGSNAGAPEYMTGVSTNGVFPEFASNADPDTVVTNGEFPRGITVQEVSGTKYAFICSSNGIVKVVTLTNDNKFGAITAANILDAAFGTATRYSKNVKFDADGNMYWASQRIGSLTTTANGRVYRWSAAQVAAAIADPVGAPLTEAAAQWIIDNDLTVRQRLSGFAIAPNGDVYVVDSDKGAFLVGNTSNAAIGTLALSTLTVAIPRSDMRDVTNRISDGTAEFWFDAAGNFVMVDGGGENIMAFAPPAAAPTTTAFKAPPSQTFEVTGFTSSRDWNLYQ